MKCNRIHIYFFFKSVPAYIGVNVNQRKKMVCMFFTVTGRHLSPRPKGGQQNQLLKLYILLLKRQLRYLKLQFCCNSHFFLLQFEFSSDLEKLLTNARRKLEQTLETSCGKVSNHFTKGLEAQIRRMHL